MMLTIAQLLGLAVSQAIKLLEPCRKRMTCAPSDPRHSATDSNLTGVYERNPPRVTYQLYWVRVYL